MGIRDVVKRLFNRSAAEASTAAHEEKVRQAFKARCEHFKVLLSANKRALETMASLEEALRGEQFFNMSFVRAGCTTVLTNVYYMVKNLTALSQNPLHVQLFDRLKEIQQRITASLTPPCVMQGSAYVLPITGIDFSLAHEVGGKMASLGEAWQRLGYPIPDGFVVTASGYRHFLAANNLQEEVDRRLLMTDFSQLDAVFALSASLKKLIVEAALPADLEAAILEQYARLQAGEENVRLAVRSSAIGEDAQGVSFAGQYRTRLNVTRENLLTAYKEVVASKYDVTALTYRFNRGIPDYEVPMCVGCVAMVNALSGGVAYSANPMHHDNGVVVNAVPGLPKTVVDGSAAVDTFRVSRRHPHEIVYRNIAEKQTKLVCSPEGGTIAVALSPEEGAAPCLTDAQIQEVAAAALAFEAFYGVPQDVEWAYAPDGTLMILQSRALPSAYSLARRTPPPTDAVVVLEGGVCASPGTGAGKVVIVQKDAHMMEFPQGAVLVVEQAHSRWAPLLPRVAAVISEYGGAAGHLASVAREYGIPALFGMEKATSILAADTVTVDADAHRVYAGTVDEVLARKRETHKIFAGSPVHKTLARCAAHIVPLNLLEPDSVDFIPANCATLHDITRYCHEKAVEEMFRVDENIFSGRYGKQLRYHGAKLQYFIVDLGGGFVSEVQGSYIDLENIASKPMLALWAGMIAIPWAGPPCATARSFLSVVAQSASNPELEITSSSVRMTRNYFMIDKDYCNLQASFGYHFCTVEAQAGAVEQENYVSFHFKGGAATMDRRQMRIRIVADILAENGFIVDVKGDALSARAEELLPHEALELLNILGYLIIHTRQMDASLQGERSMNMFGDMLRKGIASVIIQLGH